MKSGSKSFGLGVLFVQRKRLLDGSLCLGRDSFRSSLALVLQMQYLDPYVVVGLS
jgi:hypothetical protein